MKTAHSFLLFCALALNAGLTSAAEVQTTPINGEPFVGEFHHREGSTDKCAILFLGGSEGGIPKPSPFFAENGYPVLALAYFKQKGLPQTLQMVPLEYFDRPIQWMQESKDIGKRGLIVIGASKGAELALLLASRKPNIKGVIAISPSSVTWDGLPKNFWPPEPMSSWSTGGKPVSFVPYDYSQPFNPGDPQAIFKFYERSLKQIEAVKLATIPVENIAGPILMASGSDDQLWPAEAMAVAIQQRLKEKRFRYPCEHLKYKEAGHTLNEYFMLGGTVDGNRKARLDMQVQMLRFLASIDTSSATK